MLRSTSLLVLSVVLAGSPALGQDWARKMFKQNEHDFGTVARHSKAEYRFILSNPYMEDVHISSVRSSCSCTRPRIEKKLLKTYEAGAVVASINTPSFSGSKSATLTVIFDKPYRAQVQLHVRVHIRDDVVVNPSSVLLGSVDQGSPADRQVAITHTGRGSWKIKKVESTNPHLAVKAVETGRRGGRVRYDLKVRLDENAPAGYINEYVMLVTNDRRNPRIPVLVEGCVLPAVSVSPTSLFMGVVEPGRTVTKKLVVRGKVPFRILSITCNDESFEFDTSFGDGQPKQLHIVPVRFVAGENSGRIMKTIRIETDLGKTTPQLDAFAVVSNP